MQVAAACTVWICLGLFMMLPHLGAPPLLPRAAMTLLVAELLAAAFAGHASGAVAATAHTAAAIDVPALTVVLAGLCVAYGLRRFRAG